MLPDKTGMRHVNNKKWKTIPFVKKFVNEDTIRYVNVQFKEGAMSTLMFTFELEFGGIDGTKRTTKFTTIIQVTLIINETSSMLESHCSSFVDTHK